jgi:hypothetical protein
VRWAALAGRANVPRMPLFRRGKKPSHTLSTTATIGCGVALDLWAGNLPTIQ